MKDTIITARRKRVELFTLFICFIIANVCNVYAIARFQTSWKELFMSLGFVVAATVVFYGLWTALRLILYFFRRLRSRDGSASGKRRRRI